MAEQKRTDDVRERQMARQIWLEYFNSYLYEHGLITEKERNRMVSAIAADQNRKQKNSAKTKENHCNSEIDML